MSLNFELHLNDLRRESVYFGDRILNRLRHTITEGDFILGEDTQLFERDFAKYIGSSFAIGVKSGTAALYLTLLSLGIGKGDEVITTPLSFNATAEAIAHTGATPIFCDVNPTDGNIDVTQIEHKIGKYTKAILPVHLYGAACNLTRLLDISTKYNIPIIEDACQAHGTEFEGKKLGSFGLASCFSFMPAKVLGGYGDAGMVVTNDRNIYESIQLLRNHGRKSKYEHLSFGLNERIDNIQSVVLHEKLQDLEKLVRKRQNIAQQYLQELQFPTFFQKSHAKTNNFYVYPISTKNRKLVMEYLSSVGIHTGVHYPIPIHLQPVFSYLGHAIGDFPNAERICQTTMSIPMHPFLKEHEVVHVINHVNFMQEYADR